MFRPIRRYRHTIRARWISVGKINGDPHMGLLVRRIEQASCFVAGHLWFRPVARLRDIALCNCPSFLSDWITQTAPPNQVNPAELKPALYRTESILTESRN